MMNRREFLKTSTMAAAGAIAYGMESSAESASAGTKSSGSESGPLYEIYALKYAGPFKGKLAFVYAWHGWDEELERNYYIWVIKGGGETIVVDTGLGLTFAKEHKSNNYVNPVDILARIGVQGNSVKKIVLTHMHYDHVGGMEMFPQAFPEAVFYLQKKEYDFWIKNPVAKKAPFAMFSDPLAYKILADMKGTERLRLVDGDQTIAPGVELMLTPGHTVGLQAVAVNTIRGSAIVASDNAHIAKSFETDFPSSLITDLVAWMHTYDKLRAKSSSLDLIFPGHDAKLLNDYPKVAEDVTRLV